MRITTKYDASYLRRFLCLEAGVFCFPTDTLFALSCDATNSEAINKLFAIKKRPIDKTAPILVSSLDMAQEYVEFSNIELELAKLYWPGALTMVVKAKKNKLSDIAIRDSTIGIRMPNCQYACKIIEDVGRPVIGTSANIAGGPNLLCAKEISDILNVPIIETPTIPSGKSSTIIKVKYDGDIEIIRQGALQI